jgi:excisionase family DNA binding protein
MRRDLSSSERRNYPIRIQTAAAATMLGVSKRTVHGLAARGELPGAARIGKVWTFNVDKLAQFIAEREAECSKNAISDKGRGYDDRLYEEAISKWLGRAKGGSRRSSTRVGLRSNKGDE